jgi:hypothetical protein
MAAWAAVLVVAGAAVYAVSAAAPGGRDDEGQAEFSRLQLPGIPDGELRPAAPVELAVSAATAVD